jgi:hypothetical protein
VLWVSRDPSRRRSGPDPITQEVQHVRITPDRFRSRRFGVVSDDLGRRSNDVEPAVQLFVQQELADTRHVLRSDLAALGVKVELATQTSAKWH